MSFTLSWHPMEQTQLPSILEWEAYETIHVDRSPDWFWGVGLSALALAVIAILMKNLLFAVVIILAAFALTLRALKIPKLHRFAITKKGVIENNSLHSYSELESFWVQDDDYFPKLLLRSRRSYLPLIVIPLGNMDPEIVHDFLINFLDAERIDESNSQKILEYFGF